MVSQQYEMFAAGVKGQRTDATPTLEELRAGMDAIGTLVPAPDGTTVEAVDAGSVPAEWVVAPGVDEGRTILYVHGGGYCIGSPGSFRNFVARLSAAAGARVLSLDYRLAPEHPYPAAVDDAVAGYRWLVSQGVDPGRIAVCGESAGGGLTVALLLALRDAGDTLPACAVAISPWFDMDVSGEMSQPALDGDLLRVGHLELFADWYLNGTDSKTPLANPLYADPAGLPPTLVMVGGHEILLDDARRFADRARGAGVDLTLEVVPEMIHIWHVFGPMFPEADAACEAAASFIRSRAQ